jgi:hypothetical protein
MYARQRGRQDSDLALRILDLCGELLRHLEHGRLRRSGTTRPPGRA